MADMVIFFEDESDNTICFRIGGDAVTDAATQAQQFRKSRAERRARMLHKAYPQRVFGIGVMF